MNSLRPHGLFLANHFDDVDTLLIKRIHSGRQTSILLYLITSLFFIKECLIRFTINQFTRLSIMFKPFLFNLL
ncbi:hypothetical protein HanPI659440_Chr01g0029471 [Helianthus annuus]|nr:hypothetical protein HanPI659440_Chr01g0029471 [Helianthus annuus]